MKKSVLDPDQPHRSSNHGDRQKQEHQFELHRHIDHVVILAGVELVIFQVHLKFNQRW